MLLENCFTLTCRSKDFLVTFWKLICSHTVTPRWLDDVKEFPNQGRANSATLAPCHTKSRPRMLVALKAVFLENYFADNPWILNGYSIEEEVSTFQFSWCSIWKPGESNCGLVFMYCKHPRISCTFLLKIFVSNRGCGLSARTSVHHAIIGINQHFWKSFQPV